MIGHAPADDFAAEQVHHDRQVQKTLLRRHVGNVGAPLAVGLIGDELPVQMIGHDRVIVSRIGRADPEPPSCFGADMSLFHQLGHRVEADPHPAIQQFSVNAWRAVGLATDGMHLSDLLRQMRPTLLTGAGRPIQPSVKTAAADVQHSAHHPNLKCLTMLVDPTESHGFWLAK